jgi:hypothetical protein
LINALDIMNARNHIAVSGDGTTDHNLLLGPQECYSHVLEIVCGFTGKPQAVFVDGYLRSQGLTAEAERGTRLYSMALMKFLAGEAIKLFAKTFPDKVSTEAHFGEGATKLLENIGYKWFKQFKADGAPVAQKWARLMVLEKHKVLRKFISPEQLAKLAPKQRFLLF